MNFIITKTYKATKNIHPVFSWLIFLVVLPVLILMILGGLIWLIVLFLKQLFAKKSELDFSGVPKLEKDTCLIMNDKVKIHLVEDENDNEYSKIVDLWCDQVYDDENFIYRAATNPHIQGVTNKFITSFIKETDEGFFVQILNQDNLEKTQLIDTNLFFLKYSDLTISYVENIGPHLLYIDKRKPDLICGFNRKGNIELRLIQKDEA